MSGVFSFSGTWIERGCPPTGYFTKRLAEDAVRRTLDEARRGTVAGMVGTGTTFAGLLGARYSPVA
ncbi:MAG TPA: hypothetical protein VMB27_18205 [Solirubrobacteraceae bacterium]|nr:hypothetical protein [Solirubrobacteraceae bacterium]